MRTTVGANPLELRRLSRTLEDGAEELLRIRRRVDEAAARLRRGGSAAAELATVSRWLADGAVDARRRAVALEDEGRRPRRHPGGPTPMSPWFGDDACPKVLITVQLPLPGLGTKARSRPSEHLAVATGCQTEVTAPVPVTTPDGVLLAPASLRLHTGDDAGDEGGGGGRGAASGARRRRVPKGFANAESFAAFGRRLRAGLRAAGLRDAEPALQGSSVRGYSFRTGELFDVGRTSDLDVAIASPTAMSRAEALGVGLRSGGARTGPLNPAQLERLGLGDVSRTLAKTLGRPVHFMVFESMEAAAARGPVIAVPGS